MASNPTISISTSLRRRCDDGVQSSSQGENSKRELAMSAQSSRAAAKPTFVKSGAAGAATFPGSDSRKYNYFEPKGRKATHYEDMTVDVQPDPERYLLQDWIISFPDGTPTYCKDWTAAKSSNWHKFRAVDQEGAALRLHPDGQQCDPDQFFLQDAFRAGHHALSERDCSRPSGLRLCRRQAALA